MWLLAIILAYIFLAVKSQTVYLCPNKAVGLGCLNRATKVKALKYPLVTGEMEGTFDGPGSNWTLIYTTASLPLPFVAPSKSQKHEAFEFGLITSGVRPPVMINSQRVVAHFPSNYATSVVEMLTQIYSSYFYPPNMPSGCGDSVNTCTLTGDQIRAACGIDNWGQMRSFSNDFGVVLQVPVNGFFVVNIQTSNFTVVSDGQSGNPNAPTFMITSSQYTGPLYFIKGENVKTAIFPQAQSPSFLCASDQKINTVKVIRTMWSSLSHMSQDFQSWGWPDPNTPISFNHVFRGSPGDVARAVPVSCANRKKRFLLPLLSSLIPGLLSMAGTAASGGLQAAQAGAGPGGILNGVLGGIPIIGGLFQSLLGGGRAKREIGVFGARGKRAAFAYTKLTDASYDNAYGGLIGLLTEGSEFQFNETLILKGGIPNMNSDGEFTEILHSVHSPSDYGYEAGIINFPNDGVPFGHFPSGDFVFITTPDVGQVAEECIFHVYNDENFLLSDTPLDFSVDNDVFTFLNPAIEIGSDVFFKGHNRPNCPWVKFGNIGSGSITVYENDYYRIPFSRNNLFICHGNGCTAAQDSRVRNSGFKFQSYLNGLRPKSTTDAPDPYDVKQLHPATEGWGDLLMNILGLGLGGGGLATAIFSLFKNR